MYYLSKLLYYFLVRRYDILQRFGLTCLEFYLSTLSITVNSTQKNYCVSIYCNKILIVANHLLLKYEKPLTHV